MQGLVVSPLSAREEAVEVVERKGLGHPDTICDALAENFSRNLCREYRARFGAILHHNVDKALLCGGRSAPAFKGGAILTPIEIYLAGRATASAEAIDIPIGEIAVDGSRAWLQANLHALDAARDVRIHCVVQPGSQDLQQLFKSRKERPLANDTSFGVAHAPLSPLEALVLAVEKHLNGRNRGADHPAWGEDIKIMGVRNGASVALTIGCAMIGRHVAHLDDYLGEKAAIERRALDLAQAHGFAACSVGVNMADDPRIGSIFLTVSGTSAEAGDDGQVGRGNRANGLITPTRPMSLEAVAGKNPVSHVGKIYNVVAQQICDALLAAEPAIKAAACTMVSRIGCPVGEPAVVNVQLSTADGVAARFKPIVADIVAGCLAQIPSLVDRFVAGDIDLF